MTWNEATSALGHGGCQEEGYLRWRARNKWTRLPHQLTSHNAYYVRKGIVFPLEPASTVRRGLDSRWPPVRYRAAVP
jgi:hypothetical protein